MLRLAARGPRGRVGGERRRRARAARAAARLPARPAFLEEDIAELAGTFLLHTSYGRDSVCVEI